MDRLQSMQTFVRAAETGSFSAVAREQNTTQSAISKQVAALERHLGVKLFSRTTRSLALTGNGVQYFDEARRLVAEVEDAEAKLRGGERHLSGWLRVASSVGYGLRVLMPTIQGFMREHPALKFQAIVLGQTVRLGKRAITPLPAEHTVPAVGYQLDSGAGSLVFTGDTTVNDRFWPILNQIANLRYLLIETAFPNREQRLAVMSKHLCPSLLAAELGKLSMIPEIYISHLKPGQMTLTMDEIEACAGEFNPRMLLNDQVFEL